MNKKSRIVNSNPEITIKHKLFSLKPSSIILPTSLFFGEKCTLPHFLKNKQNSNLYSLCNVGEMQLWLIKTNCFTYLLLQINLVIKKIFTFKSENVAFTKPPKKLMIGHIKIYRMIEFFTVFIISFYFEEHNWKVYTSWFEIHQSTTYVDVWLFNQNVNH